MNSLTQSLALEEPSITSLAVRPGVVDTQMQNDIRTKRTLSPFHLREGNVDVDDGRRRGDGEESRQVSAT